MKLSLSQRATLFEMFGRKCAYCGCALPERGWHADHVEAVHRKGDWVRVHDDPSRSHKFVQNGEFEQPQNERLDNYYPSCRACNIDKSCMSIEEWRAMLEQRPRVLHENYSAFRHAVRFGLVAVTGSKVVFHFERLAFEALGVTE